MPTQNQDPANSYGPFTDALTGPLNPQAQQSSQVRAYPGKTAALASFANEFIKGAQRGARMQYERSEKQKMEHEANFDSVFQHIQNDPNTSAEGKKAAEQMYLQAKFSKVSEGMKGAKQDKDNPVLHLARAITGAVVGPGENKNHKDIDVNSLLSIANDPKYKVDPAQMGQTAATGLAERLQQMKQGQASQPGMADANLKAPGVPQIPGLSTPPGPPVPPQELTQQSVAMDPEVNKILAPLRAQGVDPMQSVHTGPMLSAVPKTGASKPVGATYMLLGEDGKNHRFQNYQNPDGTSTKMDLGVAGESSAGGRPVQGSDLITLEDAKKLASGGKSFGTLDGKPLDLSKVPDGMMLKPYATSKGISYEPINPRFQVVHAGNETYAAPSQEIGNIPHGAGVDLGQQKTGSSGTTQQVAFDPITNEMTTNTLVHTTAPSTPGAKGRSTTAPPPSVRTAQPPTGSAQVAPPQSSPAAADPHASSGGNMRGIPAGMYNQALQRITPIRDAANQMFGDPTQPQSTGLISFADVADDPGSQERLGKALRLSLDSLDHAQSASGGFMEWIKNQSGVTGEIASSRAQVMQGAVGQLTPREMEAYDATMNAFGTAVGLRSLSRASASQGSVKRIESELPVIGVNVKGKADFYDKMSRLAEQVYTGTHGIPKSMFQPGELEYISGLPKKLAGLKSGPSPQKQTASPSSAQSPATGGTQHTAPPKAVADQVPEGHSVTSPDGVKWVKKNGQLIVMGR